MTDNLKKPIVYSCSGCSNLARMAYDIALNLDNNDVAEMSCVSGVIGKVGPVQQLGESGRPIIAIDGCSLGCTKSCLDASDIKVDHYFDISEYGFEKRSKWDDSLTENAIAMKKIYDSLYQAGVKFPENK
jgi:uncharacterized metal-binding protein